MSQVKNSQSRHEEELTTREETTSTRCAEQLSHSARCAEQQLFNFALGQTKLTQFTLCRPNNTLVDSAGKESDVTEAKLKTSRVITKQLLAPST